MSNQENSHNGKLVAEIAEWAKTLGGAFIAYLALTTVAFANYSIPSESMVPTIEVGDRVVVNKFAYGYSRHSLPLNLGALLDPSDHRLFETMPTRGDVAVFAHPQNGKVMIKRLIGLPGDVIEVRDGVLSINGEVLPLSGGERQMRHAHQRGVETAIAYEETLPGGARHPVHQFPRSNEFDEFGPYRVPDNHLFFMGDNRDNSLDSRWDGMGPVPMENLIGRAETIYFSTASCRDGFTCPRARWLRPLRH